MEVGLITAAGRSAMQQQNVKMELRQEAGLAATQLQRTVEPIVRVVLRKQELAILLHVQVSGYKCQNLMMQFMCTLFNTRAFCTKRTHINGGNRVHVE